MLLKKLFINLYYLLWITSIEIIKMKKHPTKCFHMTIVYCISFQSWTVFCQTILKFTEMFLRNFLNLESFPFYHWIKRQAAQYRQLYWRCSGGISSFFDDDCDIDQKTLFWLHDWPVHLFEPIDEFFFKL